MAPQPQFGLTTDARLQHLMIDVCGLKRLQLFRRAGDQFELCLIIAPFLLRHLKEEDGLTVLDGDTLRACHHRGVVVQEPAPVVDIVPVGHLITQVAQHRGLILTLELDGLAEDVHQGDALCPPPSAKSQEEGVERLVLKGVVELSAVCLLRHP